ncbi:MAG TPA: polysaccharide deacetylase family protein [Candidatus Dormibacteraeota bacterium]|nr:polysaccharide deacetylase family protein [Candidatus Dormibacteraeota bacterium]
MPTREVQLEDGGRPTGHVSIDIDPIDTHLAGYWIAAPPCDLVYRTAVPRFLDLVERLGIRATLFVVARDAEAQADLWREAQRRGHEIASHSVTHPIPFASLPPSELARELSESRRRLEDVTGHAVLGFRAPGWDVGRPTLSAIAAAGYRYDASVLPTPALLAGSLLRFVLSAGRKRPHGVGRSLRAAFTSRWPYRLRRGGGLLEFPVAVSPLLRLPFTHTLWYVAPRALCESAYRAIRRSRAPLSYMLHATDFLDLRADAVDGRMARHPGMQLSLSEKLTLLEERLAAIAADYRVRPYGDLLAAAAAAGADAA